MVYLENNGYNFKYLLFNYLVQLAQSGAPFLEVDPSTESTKWYYIWVFFWKQFF